MILFGHFGIGSSMVRIFPSGKKLPLKPLLFGSIAPDLLDKPLYYIPHFISGKSGDELGFVSGTRSFGHTILFSCVFLTYAAFKRSRVAFAIAAGIWTHLILDVFLDMVTSGGGFGVPLFWPFVSEMPEFSFDHLKDYFFVKILNPWTLGAEVVGIILLNYQLKTAKMTWKDLFDRSWAK